MTYPPGSAPGTPYTDPLPPPSTPPAAGGLSENSAAAIAYLTFIPAILFLVIAPYNQSKFVRFHAIQCIAMSVVAFVLQIIFMVIPFIGWILLPVLLIGLLILWIIAIMKASKGEWFQLPVIGPFAMAQASK